MKRVEFRLTMPGSPSWNGRWSGEGRDFLLVRQMSVKDIAKLMDSHETRSWSHRWDDGWCASIRARVMEPGERRAKSAGFCGYDWMVANIIDHGSTYEVAA